jgi:hypothetical protein
MQQDPNRHGAAVIEYHGKRGTVFRIKYRDAAGVQVMETIGSERDGWTRKKADAELRERLVRESGRATAALAGSRSPPMPTPGSRRANAAAAGSPGR